ncbi:MAG: ATP-binding protein [Patescibacteria group bacterium]
MLNIYSALIWMCAIVLMSFGSILFSMNEKRSSRLLVWVVLILSFWAASIGSFYATLDPERALSFVRLGHLFGSLAALVVYLFCQMVHDQEDDAAFFSRKTTPFFAIEFLLAYLYLGTATFAKEVLIFGTSPLDRHIVDTPAMKFHFAYIAALVVAGLSTLRRKGRKAVEGHEREHTKSMIVMFGVAFGTLGVALVLTRFFGFERYYWLVPMIPILLVPLISYSIVEYSVVSRRLFFAQVAALSTTVIVSFDIFIGRGEFGLIGQLVSAVAFAIINFFLVRLLAENEHNVERLAALSSALSKTNTALEETNKRLQILDLQRAKFISIASHQLRAPLTSIVGYTSMMMEGSFGRIPKKAQGAVEKTLQSGKNLIHTINDFLDASTLEAGSLHYSFVPLELSALVREVAEMMSSNLRMASLDLSLSIPAGEEFWVSADKEKLRHVIVNLIDNSIHYTPKGSLTLALSKDTKRVRLAVSDTGVGMSKETLAKLFQKFSRGKEGVATSSEGVGLGLYLAREIAKAHGGEIVAQSAGEGKGSTFIVDLPVYRK